MIRRFRVRACAVFSGAAAAAGAAGAAAAAAVLFVAAIAAASGPAPAPPTGTDPVLAVGEKLTFSIGYGLVKAGSATLEIAGLRRFDGRPALQIVSTATSNSVFDKIYPVRDRIVSLLDRDHLHSLYFEKHLREGTYRADQSIRFDQERGIAVYDNGEEHPMEPGSLDVLGAFYKVRTLPLEPGRDYFLDSHADRKNYPIRVRVHGREEVTVPAGTFDCLVIEPTLKSGAFFKSEGKLTIWITDDGRKMPVLMRSKIPVGSISAELIAYERPDGSSGAASAAGR